MYVQTKFCRIAFQPKLGRFFKTAVLTLEMDGYFDNDNGQTLFLDGIMMDIIVDIGKYDENLVPHVWFIFTTQGVFKMLPIHPKPLRPYLPLWPRFSALISKYWVVPLVVLQKGPPPLRGSWEPHTSPLWPHTFSSTFELEHFFTFPVLGTILRWQHKFTFQNFTQTLSLLEGED